MSQKQRISAYVDYHILDLLAKSRADDERLVADWNAVRAIWKRYNKDQIRLVTSVEEIELDFVIHMNRGGLCVTDTFQITDNIDDFERWEFADRDDTGHWRAIVDLYDQLEVVNEHSDFSEGHAHEKGGPSRMHEHIGSVLREEATKEQGAGASDDMLILRDCAALLHKFYDGVKWADMKHIDYDLNWRVLKEALLRHGHSATLNGQHALLNKNLLGLLNRLVGISKKSCPRLPMKESHIDFVLDIVTKKYCQENIERHICHILRSIRSGIEYHLTTDEKLLERFLAGRERLRSLAGCETICLEVIRPAELEKRLKSRDQD